MALSIGYLTALAGFYWLVFEDVSEILSMWSTEEVLLVDKPEKDFFRLNSQCESVVHFFFGFVYVTWCDVTLILLHLI